MKPILFNTEMVRAILGGFKTKTRRVITPQPQRDEYDMWHWKDCQWKDGSLGFPKSGIDDYARYQPGDILYVRETWNCLPIPEPLRGTHKTYWYKADGEEKGDKWRPSIHMPKEAARLFLRVTAVRVERLQEISPYDAHNEGIKFRPFNENYPHFKEWLIKDFRNLWDNTVNRVDLPLFGWEANPWVWVMILNGVSQRKIL